MKNRLLIHVLAWIVLSVLYYWFSDELANIIFPEDTEAFGWMMSVGAGLILIFVLVLVSYFLFSPKRKGRR